MNNDWYFGEAKNPLSHFLGLIPGTGTWEYGWTKSWGLADENFNYVLSNNNPMYEFFITKNDTNTDYKSFIDKYDIRVGDLMYFYRIKEGKERITHAVVISQVDSDEIYYAGHTDARFKKKLSEALAGDSYTRVAIVCLSGRLS